jgi:hypothetical protein
VISQVAAFSETRSLQSQGDKVPMQRQVKHRLADFAPCTASALRCGPALAFVIGGIVGQSAVRLLAYEIRVRIRLGHECPRLSP